MNPNTSPLKRTARRIHLTGGSGSGVSTLGRALSTHLTLHHLDTDDFYWLPSDPPFQRARDRGDRLALLRAALDSATDGWVLSGSLDGWGDPLVPFFDYVVFLLVPTEVRLARLAERERQRYGDEAIRPGGHLHDESRAFLQWAAGYEEGREAGRSRPRHEAWLTGLPCPVVRIEGVLSVEEALRRVLDRILA